MAGLGAYGGAGLMGGVMGAGTGAVSAGAGAGALPTAGYVPSAELGASEVFGGVGVPSAAAPVAAAPVAAAPAGLGASEVFVGVAPPVSPAPMMDPNIVSEAMQERLLADRLATTTPTQVAKAGFGEVFKDPSKVLTKDNLKYGLAALSPALFQEKKSAQAPVDREQMQFAFDPGRLGTPTQVGGIGEYTFFRPSYTRLNPTTKMAAEGGTMTSDYTYDPETQLYSREKTPPQQDRASSGNAGPYTISVSDPTPNGFQDLTPAQQAAFFAENPAFSAISQLGQQVVGKTSLGMAQAALFPDFVDQQGLIALGQNPDVVDPSSINAINGLDAQSDAATANAAANAAAVGSGPSDTSGSGYAAGGISHLGDYSDGGRLLRGPGDGVSDSIPATIANKRPARLADGEFVVPARIVSELGNGSTEAGARKLYAMMDRIQKNRTKSVGKDKVAVNSRSEQLLPA